MSTDPIDDHPGAEVVELHPTAVIPPGAPPPGPPPAPTSAPGPGPGERRPIIPEQWQRASARATVRHHAALSWHRARFHGLRAPAYVIKAVVWAAVGAGRLALAQIGWWWVAEQTWLRSEAIAAGDHRAWMTCTSTPGKRACCVAWSCSASSCSSPSPAGLITAYAVWAWLLIAAAVLPWLATIGRPASKPIVQHGGRPRLRRAADPGRGDPRAGQPGHRPDQPGAGEEPGRPGAGDRVPRPDRPRRPRLAGGRRPARTG